MRQVRQLSTGWRPNPTEPSAPIRTVDVHAIEEQHVKIDVEIERTAAGIHQIPVETEEKHATDIAFIAAQSV